MVGHGVDILVYVGCELAVVVHVALCMLVLCVCGVKVFLRGYRRMVLRISSHGVEDIVAWR